MGPRDMRFLHLLIAPNQLLTTKSNGPTGTRLCKLKHWSQSTTQYKKYGLTKKAFCKFRSLALRVPDSHTDSPLSHYLIMTTIHLISAVSAPSLSHRHRSYTVLKYPTQIFDTSEVCILGITGSLSSKRWWGCLKNVKRCWVGRPRIWWRRMCL